MLINGSIYNGKAQLVLTNWANIAYTIILLERAYRVGLSADIV